MADVQDIYRGIISPSGGIYKPGPEVQFPSQSPNDALAQLLIQDAKGGAGLATGMRGSGELTYRDLETMANRIPGPNPVAKDQSRLPVEPAGYGPDFAPEGPVTAVPKSKYAFTGSDPFDAYKGSYVATARPASLMSRQPQQQRPDGGLFGLTMSPGMNRNLAGRAGIAGIPGLPPRIQVQQAQKAAIAQALVQSAAAAPSLGYNAAFSQTSTGDGQGNNGISGGGHWGGARSLTE